MTRGLTTGILALAAMSAVSAAQAQQAPAETPATPTVEPFVAGTPLDMTGNNVRTFGAILAAESVAYDAERDLYVIVNTGVGNAVRPNDGFISLWNPDGTVNTLKWIAPIATDTVTNGLTLNDPRGSDIANGVLYVADQGMGSSAIRMFNMADGMPQGEITIEGTVLLNDLEVADDGTIYVSDSGNADNPDAAQIYKVTPDGQATTFAKVPNRPNGVAIDPDGNIVTVLLGTPEVLTYSPEGELLKTETMPYARMDGLVILPDGTKLITSLEGYLMRVPAGGGEAEILASGIPTAASMGYDTMRNRALIPQNQQHAVTFVDVM